MRPSPPGTLAVIGCASIALWVWVAWWGILADHAGAFALIFTTQLALYALAVGCLSRWQLTGRVTFAVIFGVALLMRLALVRQPPTASDDVYRYVWDGRVQTAAINPYRYPPDDPALAPLRDRIIYPGINRKPVRTIYPPVAEAIFRLVYALYPDSVTWTKLALSLIDLATAAVLARMLRAMALPPALVLLYLWHPLLVLEVAHSGHIDVVAALFLLLALGAARNGRQMRAGVWCAGAVLVKFYALAALPALMSGCLRRRDFRLPLAFAATVGLAYVPFLSVGTHVFGFLGGYAAEEGFVSGERFFFPRQAWQLMHRLAGSDPRGAAVVPPHLTTLATAYTGFMLVVLGAVALGCLVWPPVTPAAIANRAAVLLLVLFTLTTASQPWYLLVLLVLVPLVARPLAVACGIEAASGAYGYLHWWFAARPEWPWWIEYDARFVALAIVVVWAVVMARRARTSRTTEADTRVDDDSRYRATYHRDTLLADRG